MPYEFFFTLLTNLFHRCEVNISKYASNPRPPLYDLERNLTRRLTTRLEKCSRRG